MKKIYSKVTIMILTLILGFLISVQIKNINNRYEYVPLETIRDYKQNIEKEKAEIENLKLLIDEYKTKVNDYKNTKIKDGDITNLLEDELKTYKTLSGFNDVYGPGVMIIISDATRELYEGENPNELLVHDLDVLTIINDLKIAGAEAISINNQRVLSSTGISCSGYTIEVNGVDYGLPFIIKAIGNPNHLQAAVDGPNTTGYWLQEYGIFLEVNTRTHIKIPKFDEDISYEYLITKR